MAQARVARHVSGHRSARHTHGLVPDSNLIRWVDAPAEITR
jgi:hypothetical protein